MAGELWRLFVTGYIFPALATTTINVTLGIVLGAALGICFALFTNAWVVGWVVDPLATIGNAVPKVGIVPVLILVYGTAAVSHVLFVVSFTAFIFYYNTRQGIRELDVDTVVALKLIGVRRLRLVRLYSLPALIPYFLTAVRVGVPLAYGAEIFAELLIPSSGGLGGLLLAYASSLDSAGSVAMLLIVGVIGYLLDIVVLGRLEGYSRSTGQATVRL